MVLEVTRFDEETAMNDDQGWLSIIIGLIILGGLKYLFIVGLISIGLLYAL